jgi:signal peptidase I
MTTSNFQPNPWIAGLLSLIEVPLGFAYAGRLRRGCTFWLIVMLYYALSCMLIATGKMGSVLFLLVLALLLGLRLSAPVFAFRAARQPGLGPKQTVQKWYSLVALFIAISGMNLFGIAVVRKFILESFMVPGRAMSSTIRHLDRITVDKLFRSANGIARGDIVVFRTFEEAKTLYVMRVIALGGDTVELKDNTLRVNDQVVSEPYASYEKTGMELPGQERITIPAGHFYVLGDNRNRSSDSRAFGPLPLTAYHGTATNIFFSREYETVPPVTEEDYYAPPQYEVGPILWNRIGRRLTQ